MMNEKMKWKKIFSKSWLFCHLLVYIICTLSFRVVGDVLGNLKGMAQDMGDELDRQNHQIERLDKKAQVHDIHLKQANQRIRRQL